VTHRYTDMRCKCDTAHDAPCVTRYCAQDRHTHTHTHTHTHSTTLHTQLTHTHLMLLDARHTHRQPAIKPLVYTYNTYMCHVIHTSNHTHTHSRVVHHGTRTLSLSLVFFVSLSVSLCAYTRTHLVEFLGHERQRRQQCFPCVCVCV